MRAAMKKARERMKAQYSIAGMTKGVVVGMITRQKPSPVSSPNMATGGTDINPIFRLNKRQE